VYVDVYCSKGTYIRSIAEDLGELLGVGGHVKSLHRTQAGPFLESHAVSLDELSEERGEGPAEQLDHHLLPMDTPVADLPEIQLPESSAYYFGMGNPVMDAQVFRIGDEGDMVRVFDEDRSFMGLATITDDGRVAPKRLVVRQKTES
jgi:tRNA pseudouridine55 synthase